MKIHFVGIGGIGVSALAQYYLCNGHQISGSDLAESEITEKLKEKGAEIFIKHNAKNISTGIDLVVYSPAIQEKNPELKKAKMLGIRINSYPEMLGELTKNHFTVAISGTHGKSTTTAMIALIMEKAGLDPSVIIGTKIKEYNGANFRVGRSNFLVVEADEYKESFLNYRPDIIVLTNIEADHLDHYGDLENILIAFRRYISNLKEGGVIIANIEDLNVLELLGGSEKSFVGFSLKDGEADILKRIMKIPGEHNIKNALAAWRAGVFLGINEEIIKEVLSNFKGVWRRFEILKEEPYIVVSDYGHHPTEIKATLRAARENWPEKELVCVFQPHQYQRTMHFFDDFTESFGDAGRLILLDVFSVAGREGEEEAKSYNSKKMAKIVNEKSGFAKALYIPKIEKCLEYLKKEDLADKVLLIMGAGDVYKIALELAKE